MLHIHTYSTKNHRVNQGKQTRVEKSAFMVTTQDGKPFYDSKVCQNEYPITAGPLDTGLSPVQAALNWVRETGQDDVSIHPDNPTLAVMLRNMPKGSENYRRMFTGVSKFRFGPPDAVMAAKLKQVVEPGVGIDM